MKLKKSDFKPLYDIACQNWKTKFDEKFKTFVFSDSIDFEDSFIEEMRSACTVEQRVVFNKLFPNKEAELFTITSYSEVAKRLGLREMSLEDFSLFPNPKKAFAFYKIQNIEKLFNQGWVPDWTNHNQSKWYPWFEHKSNGWVFGFSSGARCASHGPVGFYKSEEISNYIGKTFLNEYKELLG